MQMKHSNLFYKAVTKFILFSFKNSKIKTKTNTNETSVCGHKIMELKSRVLNPIKRCVIAKILRLISIYADGHFGVIDSAIGHMDAIDIGLLRTTTQFQMGFSAN